MRYMAYCATYKRQRYLPREMIVTQVNDRIMAESKLHNLTEEECTVGHVKFEGNELVSRGQCRWCNNCIQWIRPKDFDAECNPASHREDKP